jgi:hypothetical protein
MGASPRSGQDGLDVQYVGSLISGYIKDGYTPLVW